MQHASIKKKLGHLSQPKLKEVADVYDSFFNPFVNENVYCLNEVASELLSNPEIVWKVSQFGGSTVKIQLEMQTLPEALGQSGLSVKAYSHKRAVALSFLWLTGIVQHYFDDNENDYAWVRIINRKKLKQVALGAKADWQNRSVLSTKNEIEKYDDKEALIYFKHRHLPLPLGRKTEQHLVFNALWKNRGQTTPHRSIREQLGSKDNKEVEARVKRAIYKLRALLDYKRTSNVIQTIKRVGYRLNA